MGVILRFKCGLLREHWSLLMTWTLLKYTSSLIDLFCLEICITCASWCMTYYIKGYDILENLAPENKMIFLIFLMVVAVASSSAWDPEKRSFWSWFIHLTWANYQEYLIRYWGVWHGGLNVPENYQILLEIELAERKIKLSSYTSMKMPSFLSKVVQRLGQFIEYRDVSGSYLIGNIILH